MKPSVAFSAAIKSQHVATMRTSSVVKVTPSIWSGRTSMRVIERLNAVHASVIRLTPAMVRPSEDMKIVNNESAPEACASGR